MPEVAEVDRGLCLVGSTGGGHHRAEPEGVVGDAVAWRQRHHLTRPWRPAGYGYGTCDGRRRCRGTGVLALPVDQLVRDLFEEPRGRVPLRRPPGRAHHRAAQVKPLTCASDADIGESALLFELLRVAERTHVREHAVFDDRSGR